MTMKYTTEFGAAPADGGRDKFLSLKLSATLVSSFNCGLASYLIAVLYLEGNFNFDLVLVPFSLLHLNLVLVLVLVFQLHSSLSPIFFSIVNYIHYQHIII